MTICILCKNYICPSSCPSYSGHHVQFGEAVGNCSICEDSIFSGEQAFSFEGRLICKNCIGELLPEELFEIFHCADDVEFMERLGATFKTY